MRLFLLFLLLLPFEYFAQEAEDSTRLDFGGNFRFRGFSLGRDAPLERLTTPKPYQTYQPYQSLPSYQAYQGAKLQQQQKQQQEAQQAFQNALIGKATNLPKEKEKINYYDTRFTFNLNFTTSKYFQALWGMQAGDIKFGGPGNNNTSGPGTGGQLSNSSAVNVQTNFLYINLTLPESGFTARVGLQLFSSVRGRVMLARGTGINVVKSFRKYDFTIEGGALEAVNNSLVQSTLNGYATNNNRNKYIGYLKLKATFLPNMKNEIYSYYMLDQTRTPVTHKTLDGNSYTTNTHGHLFWDGLYNEINFSDYSVIVHGILNHGILYNQNPYLDSSQQPVFYKYDRHYIKGGMFDMEFIYRYSEKLSFSLLGLGTTGRPGYNKYGVQSSLQGNGYQTLSPSYSISNIAIDNTGGYALFTGATMSGLQEYGISSDIVVLGPVLLTLGYYRLYSAKSPDISNNINFSPMLGYRTSNFFGQEYDVNIRWTVYRDFQVLLRSGYFYIGDGLRALYDFTGKTDLKEFFITADHRF